MTKPLIGYRNIGRTANSWSSVDARLAFNGLTYDGWQAPAVGPQQFSFTGPTSSANYFAIAGHNLVGTEVQLFAAGALAASIIVSSNQPFLVRFPSRSSATWAIRTNAPDRFAQVNVCNVGNILELERGYWVGHQPMRHNRANRYINNLSDSGQFLGRKLIAEGANGSISLKNLSSDWIRNEWEPFTTQAEQYGFFMQHNPDQYPDEVAYCWSVGDSTMTQDGVGFVNNKGRNSVNLSVRGFA